MKLNEKYVMRDVCGESIVVARQEYAIDFHHLISLNETASFIWKKAEELGSFTIDLLVEALCSEYEVDTDTARKCTQDLLDEWKKLDLVV